MIKEDLLKIQKIIDVQFKQSDLLLTAFTHRSFLNETDKEDEISNERMEFLGDSVLQFLSSEFLYDKYKEFDEGELTNLRSKIVNTESLAQESTRLELGQFLRISRGEKNIANESKYILAPTFESILGAIYIEAGIEKCREFLAKNLFYKVEDILSTGLLKDYKSMYQELAQEKYSITPIYKVISEEGPDHQKIFEVGLFLDKKEISKGKGNSKRAAQQEAAKQALHQENIIKLGDKSN